MLLPSCCCPALPPPPRFVPVALKGIGGSCSSLGNDVRRKQLVPAAAMGKGRFASSKRAALFCGWHRKFLSSASVAEVRQDVIPLRLVGGCCLHGAAVWQLVTLLLYVLDLLGLKGWRHVGVLDRLDLLIRGAYRRLRGGRGHDGGRCVMVTASGQRKSTREQA